MTNTCSPDDKTLQERMRGCRVTMESGQLEMARPTQSIHRFFWNFHLTRCTSHICQMKHFYLQQCIAMWKLNKVFLPRCICTYIFHHIIRLKILIDLWFWMQDQFWWRWWQIWCKFQDRDDTITRLGMTRSIGRQWWAHQDAHPSTIFINGSSKWLSSIRSICTLSRF